MGCLYWFNPENDIALASGNPGFTPPKNAAELGLRGAMLPWWLGGEGDFVLVAEEELSVSRAFAAELAAVFGPGPEVVSSAKGIGRAVPTPWGWSPYALRKFERVGAEVSPADGDRVGRLRWLSHRRITIELNRRLRYAGLGEFPPLPVEVSDASEIERLTEEWGTVYVKSPWSSTGRGVACSVDTSVAELARRCEGTIRRQGSVLVEKGLDKVEDFAMLFQSDGAEVSFGGYSLFFNARGASYGGNLLLPDDEIERRLSLYVPRELLRGVASALAGALTELVAADYRGWFGVDMMVCADGRGGYTLAPCVELNLRFTMGVVAHRLVSRLWPESPFGRLLVAPASAASEGALWLVPRNDSYFIGLV
ncbi:MAG: hypothetical protein NC210_00945 [[Clostridium] fimetarium]|nr:hypothetical protein [Alistipes timonensis]MCM1404970.1 hypothetical protein [[Clostridium] fimetarium]